MSLYGFSLWPSSLQTYSVPGDGLVDFLWVDKFNGNTKVWINKGAIPTAGSSYKWELLDGPRYQGSDRGVSTTLPDCGGIG